MRILIANQSELLENLLTRHNFKAYTTDVAQETIELIELYDYDLLILADPEGLDVLRKLRSKKLQTPVLFLTETDHLPTRLKAFQFGADDCQTLDINPDELIARVRAILSRARSHSPQSLKFQGLHMDMDQRVVTLQNTEIFLTGTEYNLLEVLLMRPRTIFTKEVLLDHLYRGADEPELQVIDVFVCRLRKKLKGWDHIHTVRGKGYRLS